MRALHWVCFISISCAFPFGCAKPQGTTHADFGRLSELRIKYKEEFVFKKRGATLFVYQTTDRPIDEDKIERMYREFYFDRHGHMRRTTAMRDLKVYDYQERYQYRLQYVWWRRGIIRDNKN